MPSASSFAAPRAFALVLAIRCRPAWKGACARPPRRRCTWKCGRAAWPEIEHVRARKGDLDIVARRAVVLHEGHFHIAADAVVDVDDEVAGRKVGVVCGCARARRTAACRSRGFLEAAEELSLGENGQAELRVFQPRREPAYGYGCPPASGGRAGRNRARRGASALSGCAAGLRALSPPQSTVTDQPPWR